jgi:UTP--glucose-1-phosphate uridylyltransferase
MSGAKCALKVKDDTTFLDLTIQQIQHLNSTHSVNVPLVLMTSFNTHHDTQRIVKKYAKGPVQIRSFTQSRYPRITTDSRLPCPTRSFNDDCDDDRKAWYPPGHGDLYNALVEQGVLDQLLEEGKEYLFVSNSDNLGAVLVFVLLFGRAHVRAVLMRETFETVWIRTFYSTWLTLRQSF